MSGSTTNKQKRKLAKRVTRIRKIRKEAAIRNNNFGAGYRLDVILDNDWKMGVKLFTTLDGVEKHKTETEKGRAAGEKIAPGRVVDLRTGKIILQIKGSPAKGELPDKILYGATAEAPVVEVPALA